MSDLPTKMGGIIPHSRRASPSPGGGNVVHSLTFAVYREEKLKLERDISTVLKALLGSYVFL